MVGLQRVLAKLQRLHAGLQRVMTVLLTIDYRPEHVLTLFDVKYGLNSKYAPENGRKGKYKHETCWDTESTFCIRPLEYNILPSYYF